MRVSASASKNVRSIVRSTMQFVCSSWIHQATVVGDIAVVSADPQFEISEELWKFTDELDVDE